MKGKFLLANDYDREGRAKGHEEKFSSGKRGQEGKQQSVDHNLMRIEDNERERERERG